jgi:murein DD-endopeptidase MepM/ murein hydrolase activator NlpD
MKTDLGKRPSQHNAWSISGLFNLRLRFRQVWWFALVTLEATLSSVDGLKDHLVQRMFWGRGSLYKSSFHLLIGLLTAGILATGLASRIQSAPLDNSLEVAYSTSGNQDIVAQGSNLTSVLPIEKDQVNYTVREYLVKQGDSLQAIADKHGVSKDTIKWANNKVLSPFNDSVPVGAKLKIPEMNGVLYEVGRSDNLDSVVALTKGDRTTVVQLNGLNTTNPKVTAGQILFIPNGKLPPPPPKIIARKAPTGGYVGSGRSGGGIGSLPPGTFDDPLTHPQCAGYRWQRGIGGRSNHTGVDLSKSGGCPIRAAAAGTVKYVGWLDNRAGWSIIIDHGSGVETHYYHGDGNIWVSKGQHVSKGQNIMYMGRTGTGVTGVHLHLTMKAGGRIIDPAPYIPYRR